MAVDTLNSKLKVYRWLTLVGYIGLLATLLIWFAWWQPPQSTPRSLVLMATLIPLLIPLRGLLYQRRYTHAWTSFLTLLYFAIGIDAWFNFPAAKQPALLTVLFSLVLFVGCVMFSHTAGKLNAKQEN